MWWCEPPQLHTFCFLTSNPNHENFNDGGHGAAAGDDGGISPRQRTHGWTSRIGLYAEGAAQHSAAGSATGYVENQRLSG
ncbi:hypothetical protein AERO8C_80058 [Aeromonas veronii]|uniref:Uncharacterized protein n=1 Tax=Aeromonas veronii TaxID=654 RepID=A0A653LCK1_AERVE|nr:hypothetical protein AERO8C_80058 [Aeromonas veronii]